MSRSSSDESPQPKPYRVEYAVRVWAQVMKLPAESIALVGREVEGLAKLAAADRPEASLPRRPRFLTTRIEDVDVQYEVSDTRQVLTVLDLAPAEAKT